MSTISARHGSLPAAMNALQIGCRFDRTSRSPVASLGTGAWAAIVLLCCAQQAVALPLTPFRYETQAQRHCPGDTVVWLDFRRGHYYLKGQSRYARGFDGSYACSKEARESGYRRSLFGLR